MVRKIEYDKNGNPKIGNWVRHWGRINSGRKSIEISGNRFYALKQLGKVDGWTYFGGGQYMKKLVEYGLADRKIDPKDERRFIYKITDDGRDVLRLSKLPGKYLYRKVLTYDEALEEKKFISEVNKHIKYKIVKPTGRKKYFEIWGHR